MVIAGAPGFEPFENGVTFDGDKNRFRPPTNGMHQRTRYTTRRIARANQGQAFEVDDAGETVFSLIADKQFLMSV